ncbi:uncharacterized protein BO66DRAFT_417663 [Aspergillus aculeatinus CBS 121060]|uniref:Uncharacterized protein n=1 Tax=Aspergillus aculeatinus CBS 121060 TaxID=1448322 RepID=A0ACD1HKD9_9EURO|nr:hypothetical protein BO66DRAFT_417663 [Aspergillus aculeatinus CBS 121060]RAH73828.1 hypothetical protein BO66DRAFT_417663 [Aspergillus aculeatinus CBS 121060]
MSGPRVSKSCGNCRAVKRQCPGYRDQWDLVFRDQTNQTIQRSQCQAASTAMTHSPLSPPPPLPSLCLSMDQVGVNAFLHHFVTGDHSPSRGYLNYIPATLGANDDQPTLVASLAAVGLVTLANSHHQPELVRQARIKYAEAIRSVNAALASPVESVKDSTLMAVISLGVFEHFSGFDAWVRHVQGAAALTVLRGKGQFAGGNPTALLLFTQVRTDIIAACTRTNRPFPADMRALQDEAAKHVGAPNAVWEIGVLATRCVDLLWQVMETTGTTQFPDLLSAALAVERDFEIAMATLAVQEPFYTTTAEEAGWVGSDPDTIYNGRVDIYLTPWAIRAWNNARSIQMIVCEIICYLLKKILTLSPAAPAAQVRLRRRQLHETLGILSRVGEDILATVPQALGIVAPPADPSQPYAGDLSPRASVSGAYILIWCLYMVGKSPATAEPARKWIIRRFRKIFQGAGMEMALPLLEEIVRVDQSKT